MSDLAPFPPDYRKGRAAFLDAASIAGLSTITRMHPREIGRDGKPLFVDTAIAGERGRDPALVLLSGVHGVEGYFGSAVLSTALRQGWLAGFSGRVVLVHALNPFGFSFDCRTDENNIDLNRNFVDHVQPPDNPGYERLADAVMLADPTPDSQAQSDLALRRLAGEGGEAALQAALAAGQYRHPNGLCFGGFAPSWSAETVFDILREELKGCRRLIVLDLHTGLGAFGAHQILSDEPAFSPAFAKLRAIWPQAISMHSDSSVATAAYGSIGPALGRQVEDAIYAVLEVGTLPVPEVFAALRLDLWLHAHGRRHHPEAEAIAATLRAAFLPDDSRWRANALAAAHIAVKTALRTLK